MGVLCLSVYCLGCLCGVGLKIVVCVVFGCGLVG